MNYSSCFLGFYPTLSLKPLFSPSGMFYIIFSSLDLYLYSSLKMSSELIEFIKSIILIVSFSIFLKSLNTI